MAIPTGDKRKRKSRKNRKGTRPEVVSLTLQEGVKVEGGKAWLGADYPRGDSYLLYREDEIKEEKRRPALNRPENKCDRWTKTHQKGEQICAP